VARYDATPPLLAAGELRWLLGCLCQAHRIAFDADLVERQFPPPHTALSVHAAATALGFELQSGDTRRRIDRMVMPVIAFAEGPAASGAGQRTATTQPVLILRADSDRILYFRSGTEVGEMAAREPFERSLRGPVWSVTRPQPGVAAPSDEAPDADERPHFGFGWFRREILRHTPVWRDVLLASLAIQVLGLATPLFTQAIIDKVIVHRTTSTLVVLAAALAMFMLFSSAMTWIRQYLVIHTGNRIDAVLGAEVFSHLLRVPMRFFEHRPTGVLVARLHGVETIREFVTGAGIALLLDLPFLLLCLALMFWYSWPLTLIALGILAVIGTLSVVVTPLLRARLNEQFLLGARNQAFATEYVAGIDTVKALQLEPQLERRYGDYLAGYLHAGFRTRSLGNTYHTLATGLESAMTLAILCVGAWFVMTRPGMTIGMLVAFQMFASRLSQPVLRFVGLWQEFQQASIAVQRLGDVMNVPSEPFSLSNPREPRREGGISIRGLGFRHAEDRPWLFRYLDLDVAPGEFVVLAGASGSGKSTLAKLLLGFYQPQEGSIRIDGHDSRHLAANELRACFGVVPQDTVLFSGTVYDNLTLADPHATFADVTEACRQAEIHTFIESLPDGYQTVVGEHGTGLSGGQKQRIAIARALLKRPKVLIFDEATSHLDGPTARQFGSTLSRLRGRVTVLFIAHQVPEGLQPDKTIRLDSAAANGRYAS
jgi:ATP-binding cassette, subfamily B, bacterial HlyB/CyaB